MSLSDMYNDVSPHHILSIYSIIFGVTVVNEDKQAGKTKEGVQIVARIWQEKAAAHLPPSSVTPQLALIQIIIIIIL